MIQSPEKCKAPRNRRHHHTDAQNAKCPPIQPHVGHKAPPAFLPNRKRTEKEQRGQDQADGAGDWMGDRQIRTAKHQEECEDQIDRIERYVQQSMRGGHASMITLQKFVPQKFHCRDKLATMMLIPYSCLHSSLATYHSSLLFGGSVWESKFQFTDSSRTCEEAFGTARKDLAPFGTLNAVFLPPRFLIPLCDLATPSRRLCCSRRAAHPARLACRCSS